MMRSNTLTQLPVDLCIKIGKQKMSICICEESRSLVTLALLRGAAYMQRNLVAVLNDCKQQRTTSRQFYKDDIHFKRTFIKPDEFWFVSWFCFRVDGYIFELSCPQDLVSRIPAALQFAAGYMAAVKDISRDRAISLCLKE